MPSSADRTRRRVLPVALGCLLAAASLAGCSMFTPVSQHSALRPSSGSQPATVTPTPTPTPTPQVCAKVAPRFSCTMRNRIRKVQRYLRHLPGSIGLVLHDRVTGATWHNGNATTLYPAASTIKLAMMTDLLLRNRAGTITLTPGDRAEMFQALYTSNDDDATALWNQFEDASFMDRVRDFGMGSTQFTSAAFWGDVNTTPMDLSNLINYVLDKTPPRVRGYLVYRLRHVSAIDQQWGVWGAGPDNQPGNKDGWEQNPNGYGVWITNTVGFAGPDQRYTLAIMYNLGSFGENGDSGFDYGTNKLTQISAMLFQGHHTGHPTPQASAVP